MRFSSSLYSGSHGDINWHCPDWKSYTLEHPQLQKHVQELAKKGLKDPWIRNYAWHFSPKIYQTTGQFLKNHVFARAPLGFALAVVFTIAIRGYEAWEQKKSANTHHSENSD